MSSSITSQDDTADNGFHALLICTRPVATPPVTLTPETCHAGCVGFAFINADSTTDVCAVEAVKLEDLDPEAVRAGLSEYQAKLGSLQARTCTWYSASMVHVHVAPVLCCEGSAVVTHLGYGSGEGSFALLILAKPTSRP